MDAEAIRKLVDLGAESLKVLNEDANPVRFLDPKFLCIADFGDPIDPRRQHCENRNLVDHERDSFPADRAAAKRRWPDHEFTSHGSADGVRRMP